MYRNLILMRKTFTSVIVFCLIILMVTLNLLMDRMAFNNSKFIHSEDTIEFIPTRSYNRIACKLPLNIDPFDKSVKPYIEKFPNRVECNKSLDFENNILSFIDSNNKLMINKSKDVKCFYQFFNRVNDSDDDLLYEKSGPINSISGTPMKDNEFVNVSCFRKNKKVYKNFHYVIPNKENKSDGEYHPSVLILVIESMSRINFIRHMPETKRELERLGNITYLKGLTKIDDNSYPNMVSFLTGKRVGFEEIPNDDGGPFDDFPFIWKNFESKGYSTAIIEDSPWSTLFNYISKGFIKGKPTSFYPRPFWLHLVNNQKMGGLGTNLCVNDKAKPVPDVLLNQVKAHVENNKFSPTFTFAFLIDITHEDFNQAQMIDLHYARFLSRLREKNKDNILILMGDHGNRFGPITYTDIGKIEERMPLFAIHLPDKLNSKHPHLNTFLKQNSDKLVTWLDLHQLLLDIVKNNYTPYDKSKTYHRPEVYSPWRHSIPFDRTCIEALIPEMYCLCYERKPIQTDSYLVENATKALVKHLNTILPSNLCEKFTLNSTNRAHVIINNKESTEQTLELTIVVNPSKAELRAQVYRKKDSYDWFTGDITRINKYGNQSHCIRNVYLKKFCYCKIQ